MDKITTDRINLLHPKVRSEVFDLLSKLEFSGITIRIVQGLRTFAEQDTLYTQGRTTPGHIITYAKGGESPHCFGLGIDFCLIHKDGTVSFNMTEDMNNDHKSDWMEIVNAFKLNGWTWGGEFKNLKDNDHLEKLFGYTLPQLKEMYLEGKLENGYVNI